MAKVKAKKTAKKKATKKVAAKKATATAVKQETTPREDQKQTFLQAREEYKRKQAEDFNRRFGRS